MAVKPVIRGLIDRQGYPAKNVRSAVKAFVLKVNWADLQPTNGGPVAWHALDQAIIDVRNPASTVYGDAIKLRVFAGVGAPDWAKNLGGAPVPYVSSPDQTAQTGTIGRWWNSHYQNAYTSLQKALALQYDTIPEIRELTLSMTCTFFDEPMVRNPIPENINALLAAGYTEAADKAAFVASLNAHRIWVNTTTDIDFSPFPIIVADGYHGDYDMDWTIAMITQSRAILGSRAGLQNNALSTDKLSSKNFQELYAAMKSAGAPIIFQTAAKSRIGDPVQTLDGAITYGAGSVELPQGYPVWGLDMLQKYNTQLGGVSG